MINQIIKMNDDILNYIGDFMDIKSKVYLYISTKDNTKFIKLCYIIRITESFKLLTQNNLQQNIFNNLVEINCCNNCGKFSGNFIN